MRHDLFREPWRIKTHGLVGRWRAGWWRRSTRASLHAHTTSTKGKTSTASGSHSQRVRPSVLRVPPVSVGVPTPVPVARRAVRVRAARIPVIAVVGLDGFHHRQLQARVPYLRAVLPPPRLGE